MLAMSQEVKRRRRRTNQAMMTGAGFRVWNTDGGVLPELFAGVERGGYDRELEERSDHRLVYGLELL